MLRVKDVMSKALVTTHRNDPLRNVGLAITQESTTAFSPSSITGTLSDPCGAIAAFSVKRHGIESADNPLCASAIRVRQQNGLNGRAASVPTSS